MPNLLPHTPTVAHVAGGQTGATRTARLACWLLAAAFALGACQRQPAADASQIPHTPIPKTDATLQVANNNGAIRYTGSVADAATRDALIRSLASVYGRDASGEIAVQPDTNPPPWTGNLGALFAAFRLPGAVLDFRGKRIELSGMVSDEDRANLLKTTQRLYPGYELGGLFLGVDMKQALPDAGDTAGLIEFLNALPLRFQDDSGMVQPASLDGFARGARALKAAAPGTRIEAGVYAESSDMPDYDLQIAAQRAEAVRLQLAIRGANPLSIQPRVLPASADKGGQVVFTALPAGEPAAAQAAGKDTPADGSKTAASADADEPAAPPATGTDRTAEPGR